MHDQFNQILKEISQVKNIQNNSITELQESFKGLGEDLFALLLGLAIVPSLNAQSVPWARSAAMAGVDFALTRGFAAIESNPANLYIQDSVAFSFGSSLQGGRVMVTGAGLQDLGDIVTAAGVGDPRLA